jgi:hypothetical protein
MTDAEMTRLSVAQYSIYGYSDYCNNGILTTHDVDHNLPRSIILPDSEVRLFDRDEEFIQSRDNVQRRLSENYPNGERKYTWLYNPGCWVEEQELIKIKNSHDQSLPGFDPEKRILAIFDAICEQTVAELIAHSFCNKCFRFFSTIPELEKDIVEMFKKSLYQGRFPDLHHNFIIRPQDPKAKMSAVYEKHELLVDTYRV